MVSHRWFFFLGFYGVALGAPAVENLEIFSGEHPISFFFREADAYAALGRISYPEWAARYQRLSGIMGKMLDEEVLGRGRAQPFFRRFKAEHPSQAVLLHSNPNFRNPDADNRFLSGGHWLYYNGSKVLDRVRVGDERVVLRVSDTSVFNLSPYSANPSIPDDVGLCTLDDSGKPDWSQAEQTKLVAVDRAGGTITLQRGLYGSSRRAFAAGRVYAAAHVAQTWGTTNKLWELNLSTAGPHDASGRTAGEVWADALIGFLRPGGALEFVDGVEFDVPFRRPMALGGARRADCDADGRADDGVVDGVPVFAIGVDNFFRRLRAGLPDRLLLADVGDRAQRSLETLNGVETEGWPRLRDPEFHAWSTALNDHAFWEQRARPPVLTYGLVKFRGQENIPFTSARLATAGPLLTGSMVPSTFELPPDSTGILDEIVGGALGRRGWLGRAVAPARHLATEATPLHLSLEFEPPSGVLMQQQGNGICARADDPKAEKFSFRLAAVRHDSRGDLVVRLRLSAARRANYPRDSYRLIALGAVPAAAAGSTIVDSPTSPANEETFSAVFYLRDVPSGKISLLTNAEGAEAVEISDVEVFSGADLMVAEFERGVVLANPSSRPAAFDLATLFPQMRLRRLQATTGQDAVTNDGKPVAGVVELSAHDALFLIKG